MPSPLPRRVRWVLRSSRPASSAFLVSQASRRPHHPFRGLLSVHSRYGLHARGVALRPFASKVPAASLPPRLLRLLLAGATVARRDSLPLRTGAFSRHTEKCGLAMRTLLMQCSVGGSQGSLGVRWPRKAGARRRSRYARRPALRYTMKCVEATTATCLCCGKWWRTAPRGSPPLRGGFVRHGVAGYLGYSVVVAFRDRNRSVSGPAQEKGSWHCPIERFCDSWPF